MPGLNLTRQEAVERAALVKPTSYAIQLDLTKGETTFASNTTISFAGTPGARTFVDLVADQVHRIELNGVEIPIEAYQDNRIAIGPLAEENTLVVNADCLYMHTGEGLHAFTDPADGKRYCYSQFEVPDARRVFATFEQPDLKATFQFTVTTPPEWTVFSNSPTPEPISVEEGLRFEFEPSPVISTYITAIVAGPYYGVTSSYTDSEGKETPMGVYCRQSLAEHLDADFVLDITKAGFAFFEKSYGIPYPFGKYDQIFVPEYNAGAMENAGCVTFRDQYVFRSKPTAWQLEALSNTILHELAHMWFGDLVTMQWWDDLWLNESFAEFMSHFAASEATEFKDAWIGFLQRKEWGLDNDQLPTTHPIKAEIRDLEDVEVNFDGITYAKGAAVLRQLVSYVGRDYFLSGINSYLTKHSFGNATLADLLGELEATSGRDLSRWSKVWLEESGVTVLRPDIRLSEDGAIQEFAVLQEAFSPGASLRPHRLKVGGYDLVDGTVTRIFSTELDVDGERTVVPELAGQPRPALLLVNDEDLAYAKIRLDSESLRFAIDNIAQFSDPLARRIILSAAWDMTRDAELPATQFIQLAIAALPTEKSVATVTGLLNQINRAAKYYAAPNDRSWRLESTASSIELLAKTAPAESDQQRLLVKSLASLAQSPSQFETVKGLYEGTVPLLGLDIDTDLKWDLLCALVRGGVAGDNDIEQLHADDNTMTGEQRSQQARASIDSADIREEAWQTILHDVTVPNDTRWALVSGFWAHAATKPAVYAQFIEKFFDEAVRVWDQHTFHIASGIIESMFPVPLAGYLTEYDIPQMAQTWLDNHEGVSSSLRRLMVEAQADTRRMIQAQQCDSRG